MPNNLVATMAIFNKDSPYSVRWQLCVRERSDGVFEVEEYDTRPSLFKQPMATGSTIGEAIDNFLKIEKELIKNL